MLSAVAAAVAPDAAAARCSTGRIRQVPGASAAHRRSAPAPSARDLRCALQHRAAASSATAASTAPPSVHPGSGLQQDPASTGPRRPDQPIRARGLKPLVIPVGAGPVNPLVLVVDLSFG